MAAGQKTARDLRATLCFTDESGFLLLPLVRTTQARAGHTPVLRHRASHREKVSLAAALTLSPGRGHVSLYYQDLVGGHFDADGYAAFVRRLLRAVPGPVVLLHDGGPIHRGGAVSRVMADFPRLHVHRLPPYAPDLNPPEHLFNYAKDKRLANFAPRDQAHLDDTLVGLLQEIKHDQQRLRSFLTATPLPWNGTTLNS